MLLSDDKISHLAHLILRRLAQDRQVRLLQDETLVLREIKRIIAEEVKSEEEIDQAVRGKLASYARPIPEGGAEWEVLYQKFFKEEQKKRSR
jgi:hypothetical protein